ncbi:MAG: phosphonate ABC transporter ATP-binding protein [Candidatus Cloacimonadaceae bacterium]|jgi:phosphonate transport system ATP-binding protein|nr:phosphonate ABC transporter ATP-binding protein [Candidatus Cloacimonadota bacterium]MDD5624944.1 phosphonate ABC transporter ATP-binding protein [Candidatus Cloacimonadota bacterium]MDY0111727.1 phosphonate ABC transporter ATP-binding protein [Candidatus Syntrophosphaera sp.]
MSQLNIQNLYKTYDNKTYALQDISFEVQKNDFIILLGLSGSGKSTLLRCINRLVEPNSGNIIYEGKSIINMNKTELRQYRRHIGMIFQQFNLVKNLTVLTNVLTGRLGYHSVFSNFTSEEIDAAYQCLKRVGLEEYAHKQVRQLSGGQQQRVAIARALMQEPELILADEPVASLDPATADSIMQYLGEINQEGVSVICSLHFLTLARRYGNRVIGLKQGVKVFEGNPEDIDKVRFKEIYGEEAEEI